MKCIECGHELKDGAIFCIRCGTMQVSMDGSRIEREHMGRASDHQQWPTVEPQAGAASNWKSATVESKPAVATPPNGGRHSRDFEPPPQGNGRRIAAIVIGLVMAAALIAIFAFSCMNQATSGTESSSASAAGSESASSATSSETSASASTSSASASSAASSASSASAASAASSAAAQQQAPVEAPTIVNEPEPQPEVYYEPEPVYYNNYYVLGDSSSRYYSEGELSGMSNYDLYFARNEIFARHGRMFQNADLQEYFNSQEWYTPLYTPAQWDSMPNQLSDVEQYNSNLMRQIEASRGSPYL